MLAAHYGVEIVIASCETLSFLRYADGTPERRVYLLYTGQHYDPLLGADGALQFSTADAAATVDAREASALNVARTHNKEAAERALEKRVMRLKCSGCGAILDDAAAFQEHCSTVEHDDDFTYDCEQVEVVVRAGEELPDGAVDLNAPDVFAFYNAQSASNLSLSMACDKAPFEFESKQYSTLESFWRAMDGGRACTNRARLAESINSDAAFVSGSVAGEAIERRRELLAQAIRVRGLRSVDRL